MAAHRDEVRRVVQRVDRSPLRRRDAQGSASRPPAALPRGSSGDPGGAQAGFGEADFCVYGVRERLQLLRAVLPYSNIGFAQVFPSENSGASARPTKQVFERGRGARASCSTTPRRGQARVRRRAHHRDLRRALRPLRVRLRLLQPESGHRERGDVERRSSPSGATCSHRWTTSTRRSATTKRLPERCEGLARALPEGRGRGGAVRRTSSRCRGLPGGPLHPRALRDHQGRQSEKVRSTAGTSSTDPSRSRAATCRGPRRRHHRRAHGRRGGRVCSHERAYRSAPSTRRTRRPQIPCCTRRWADGRNNAFVRAALPVDSRLHGRAQEESS